jgi:two-component system, LytTR family, sensor histidine kinase AlgZ
MKRRWLFSLLWVNAAVTVLVPLLQMATNHSWDAKELLRVWASAVFYANVAAIPAVVLMPLIVDRAAARKLPLVPIIILGCILFTVTGCLVAQLLSLGLGIGEPQRFWQAYLSTLRAALLLAVVFGLGAYFYASVRDRLSRAENELHEKQLAEERTSKLAAEARLRSLESRLHPHFLFNTLNSISSLTKIDPARAERLIGRLAALLRSSLDHTIEPLIRLDQELAMVEDYLEIEKVRFGGKLRGRLEVPGDLRDALVPPLSIQSLVENAVKHGITPQHGGGEFLVSGSTENGSLRIEVSDTGPGFDLAAIPAGHGLDNLVGRLDALFGPRAHVNVLRRDGRCVVEMVLPRS